MAFQIQTDNIWPAGLINIFERKRGRGAASFENRYYGPYDKLLNYCFGSDFTFYVAPQIPLSDDSRETVDFILYLVVLDMNDKPVLLVEVKADSWARKAELRYRADKHMRDRYAFMLDDASTPRLWGLSVLGTSMRVYRGDKATYRVGPEPVPRPDSAHVLPPTFLAGEWDIDILSQEGFDKMKEIVNDILTHLQN